MLHWSVISERDLDQLQAGWLCDAFQEQEACMRDGLLPPIVR